MKSLKLNQLNKEHLNNIKGGQSSWTVGLVSWIKDETGNIVNIKCQCSCKYANNGGSSTHDNFSANDARNLTSEPQP